MFQCSQREKAKRTFPAFSQSLEWAGPDTILQAEKIFVLAAGTPRISRLALERLGGGRKKQWQVNEPIRVALAVAAIADPLKTFDFVVDKVSAIKL